ncbi:stemmadenine O-acetyltransferase-like [Vigna umbellata]|uniref:stemmadenine O-acetyltransferase-like n=1 Tax=Vigna umbellata TaxID=87088 RepID=UPI001F5E5CFC|nr:stemmadenine O-acetyltransferase-like [Vigna umbellata]
MRMEINITSRETIKPSLPTSVECKTLKLCLFDVFQLNTYFPLILFYKNTTNLEGFSECSTQLKKSLSEALTIFYPLAGRRCDYFSIDCNDEGVIFMEASVNTTMEVLLKPPNLEQLNQLLPCEPIKCHPHQEVLPQFLVQVNKFQCGGIAIGLCNLHILLDAYSCSAFLKTWFSICKGSKGEISRPNFSSAASAFPPAIPTSVRPCIFNVIEENCTTRRFLFDHKAINELKSMSTCDETKPTRYQVVSSFISKHMIVAIKEECCEKTRAAVALHIGDIRKRMGEPFIEGAVGNLVWPALVFVEGVNKNTKIIDLVEILKKGLGKLTKDVFLNVQNDPSFLWNGEYAELMLEGIPKNETISLVFTSWVNIGFNEVDFGCGNPFWLAYGGGTKVTTSNSVILMETREGIEAWITMTEKHITILEQDVDFLRFAFLNPSVSI